MPDFHSVIFDCDSTLSSIEGIEVLATSHREEIARLTDAAMRGELPLEDIYGRRLALVRPTRSRVAALGQEYIATLVPDAAAVVAALRGAGVDVRIISGGLRPAVAILGHALGVPDASIAAVDVFFGADGAYAGFDDQSPLAHSGGKRVVIEQWRAKLRRPVMLVGDGATDLEARPVVDRFVAFAGVVERQAVVEEADATLRCRSLAPILPLALGGDLPRETSARATYEKGLALLGDERGAPAPHSSAHRLERRS
jgi:phosphoserine phosphatase